MDPARPRSTSAAASPRRCSWAASTPSTPPATPGSTSTPPTTPVPACPSPPPPVIGDINRHNPADISIGDLGQHIYSVTPDGTSNPGWPYLALDSTFSSGALTDVNGDGQTDLVVGGDSNPGPQGTHPRGGL